jgi:Domain of unknown function (DUF4430)
VFRRSLALIGAVAVAAALSAPVLGASVRIRVEGRTRTIFGQTEPRITAADALKALDVASRRGEFYYHVTQTSYGPYVDQIGRYKAFGSSGWTYKVDGVSPPVGADKYVLKDGDRVLWYWAFFGLHGGPPTLTLKRTQHGCYRVFSQDDQGRSTRARGAVLRVDGRKIRTKQGRACIGPHRGLVKAFKQGSVRSNAVR